MAGNLDGHRPSFPKGQCQQHSQPEDAADLTRTTILLTMGSDQANMESESNPRSNSTSHLPDHSNDEHTHVPADSLPDPVPGPTKDSSSNSWPVLPHIKARRSQRQFFISPFPLKLNAKVAKNALNKEKTPSSDVVVFSVAEITKQATGSTTRSDATEAELDHDLRIEDRRRRQEFPRRLLTAAVGGIFVIVPMVSESLLDFAIESSSGMWSNPTTPLRLS